ncbi:MULTISPECIES: hypothetical protein [Mycobacterium]|uniref:hypothetical protein n=1 Tax=Mycobacterium TaxID=1763 RepID=UPI0004D94EAE|nr:MULTISPECIES: hypothetical protein [Mycobacterium]KEF99963.1 hypothetical protein K883_00013 [Mycobacterium sp. TKK-01-0059]
MQKSTRARRCAPIIPIESRRPAYLSEVAHMTDVVGLDDLTTFELASLANLLAPAYTRKVLK